MKTLYINLLIVMLLIIAFDTVMFWFLPEEKALVFDGFRKSTSEIVGGRAYYPKDYFVKHETRGFDIGRNRKGTHWVDGVTYPIWSNSVGCFDNEHIDYNQYVYFTGDSYTWGYTPFQDKFGTVVERKTGTPILKCGVTHTGQLHQFEKFREIADTIKKPPKAIFVFYYWNDAANDFAHPHSTVIDGWLLDNVLIDKHNLLLRYTDMELKLKLKAKLKKSREDSPSGWLEISKAFLKQYSLSANMARLIMEEMGRSTPATSASTTVPDRNRKPMARGIYKLPLIREGRYWYSDNPVIQKNISAILAFKQFTDLNQIQLEFVLIPEIRGGIKSGRYETGWYEEFQSFLEANAISYIDLTDYFNARGLMPGDLAWRTDGHFNPEGNKVIAEILVNEYPNIFSVAPREK